MKKDDPSNYKLDSKSLDVALKQTKLDQVKNVIFIASGKGGVGKSTVATNLSVALSQAGYATGIFDADIYGPSLPLSFGVSDENGLAKKENKKEVFFPIDKYGVRIMSLGFYINKSDALIWRAPMATSALNQLIDNTEWGELEFLVIDMPPGTGDIAITLAKKIPRAKAIVVITPQEMALADGRKAIKMFNADGIDIDVLGIVENMAWFTPEKHPEEKYFLFGKNGGTKLANETGLPLLAQLPLVSDVCELGDEGKTAFASENLIVQEVFQKLVDQVVAKMQVFA